MKKQIRKDSIAASTTATNKQGCSEPLKVYFAGDLWDHKHLTGNAILSDYIDRMSKGRYQCVVPQNLEQATFRAVSIRNQDLKQVMTCDMAVFNFDGTDLDSGTVVEYMFAKMLDVPAVIIRSDLRHSGEGIPDSDPWNLMVSGYPRSKFLQWNGMEWYQQEQRTGGTVAQITRRLYTRIAGEILKNLDLVRQTPPTWSYDGQSIRRLFEHALRFPGSEFEKLFSDEALAQLIRRKLRLGLIATAPLQA